MNIFDYQIIAFFNSFSRCSIFFDKALSILSDNVLFKGGLIVPFFWWFWFNDKDNTDRKEHVISTLIASFFALFAARFLALTLPFRCRPLHNPNLHFKLPYGVDSSALIGWSSFPSDHAVLFFSLAIGLTFMTFRYGVLAIAYVFTVICLPRVYLGYHYPTDIIAGALLGAGISYIANTHGVRKLITRKILIWETVHPGSFYVCFFVLSCQMVAMFDPIRKLVEVIVHSTKLLF